MKVGDEVRTAIALPGIPAGIRGVVKEIGRPFVVVAFADGRHGYYVRRQLRSIARPPGEGSEAEPALTRLGLDNVVIPRSAHLCLLASTPQAAAHVTACYSAEGMRQGETTMCAMPRRAQGAFLRCLSNLGVDGAAAAQSGQLRIVTREHFYLPASRFDARRQLATLAAAVGQVSRTSSRGLRLFGHVGRMHRARGWWEYEAGVSQILRDAGFSAICVYDSPGRADGTWAKAASVHTHVLRDEVVAPGGVAS